MSDCKPRDLPDKPWRIRKVVLDQSMVLRILTGETLVVQHIALPADAEIVATNSLGTDVILFVQSQTFGPQTCKCTMPAQRVNYSTGG